MHYEIRSQKSSSSDPPTTGSTVPRGVTDSRPRAIEGSQGDGESPARDLATQEGEALPFPSARNDRTRSRYAGACGPWLRIHGDNRTGPGSAPPSAALYPGHAAGPVLQHRPSETLTRLWTELERPAT